ncbi:MAG: hypothetical protein V4506_16535 [Bacteroidota bacterium]
MRKLPIVYLALISTCFLFGCNEPETTASRSQEGTKTQYDSILDYFNTRQHLKLNESFTKLFVVTENGCMPCNKKFLNLVKENLADTSAAFVIGVSGNYFDIAELKSSKNIFMDQSILETGYQLFHRSKIIYLKHKNIDTIITIDARQIEEQFNIIKNRH